MPETPPTDQIALRDRIAGALYERERPLREPAWRDAYAMDREVFEAMADAVLAVVSVPAHPDVRAAALREAIDVAREEGHRLEAVAGIEPARGARSVAYLLRKLLVKVQQGPSRLVAEVRDTESAQHVGGGANAEDCPRCKTERRTLPYPFICPAEHRGDS